MGWSQKIEVVHDVVILPPPVKKQVWDGEKFVPMTLYKQNNVPNSKRLDWLEQTYGYPGTYINGRYWDYSKAGNFVVMDEQVYTWYQLKWGKE